MPGSVQLYQCKRFPQSPPLKNLLLVLSGVKRSHVNSVQCAHSQQAAIAHAIDCNLVRGQLESREGVVSLHLPSESL